MKLNPSNLIVNLFNKEQEQEKLDRLKMLLQINKTPPEPRWDLRSIANIEKEILEIQDQLPRLLKLSQSK